MSQHQRTLVKICGTTSVADAQLAAAAGADFLGAIVEHPPSPRNVSREQAREIFAATPLKPVAVTVNRSLNDLLALHEAVQSYAIQLHGDEDPQLARDLTMHGVRVWAACSGDTSAVRTRALSMTEAGAEAVLLDARVTGATGTVYGGTGHRSDWELARQLVDEGLRVVLAGGLSPDNVATAIATVRPWMVDVVSGVEATKGTKDPERVRLFIHHAHQ